MNNVEKVLCVIDVQKEYNTDGRPFCIPNIQNSLAKGQEVLKFAREKRWPIVHVQHLQESGIFAKGDTHANFIDGFEPALHETSIAKSNFSCFSSKDFCQFLEKHKDKEVVVIGYGSTMCCLSTIIEGYHRGYKFVYVRDASAAKPTAAHSSEELHKAAVDIVSTFCSIQEADTLTR
jgi:ureidoacrylate peracid hydrolase